MVEGLLVPGRLKWHYQGDPDPSLKCRALVWAAGRVLGGSSSINGMVYGRGLPADYARWVAVMVDGPGGQIYEPAVLPHDDAGWLAFMRANAGLNWHVWTALLAQEIIMAENAISGAVVSSACLMRG